MPWRDYMEKALVNLQAAEVCYRENLADPTASRAYYSVFHAAIAALLRFGAYRAEGESWDHAEIQAEFNRRLIIRQKMFPAELGRIPSDLLNYRHVADYRRNPVSKRIAGRCMEKARRFVSAVENKLKEGLTNVPGSQS